MSRATAHCDQIIALIDTCLAESDLTASPAPRPTSRGRLDGYGSGLARSEGAGFESRRRAMFVQVSPGL